MSTGLVIPSYATGFARNAAEAAYPELWRGLVGCWCPFLGPGGLVLRDISGHHNHGTLTNMDPATDWDPTPHGWGLDFESTSSQYVTVQDWGSWGLNSVTLGVLFKPESLPANNFVTFVHSGQSGANPILTLGHDSAGFIKGYIEDDDGGQVNLTGDGTQLSVGAWQLIVVVYDRVSNLATRYLNGVATGTADDISGINTTIGTLAKCRIGCVVDSAGNPAVNSYIDGTLGLALAYRRGLSAAEIRLLCADPHAIPRAARPRRRPMWAPQRAGVRVLAAYDRDEEVGEATSLQLYGNDGEGGAMDWDNAIGSASLATALKHQVVEIESAKLWHGRTYNVEVRARTAGGTESDNTDTTEVTGDGVGPGTPTLQTDIV